MDKLLSICIPTYNRRVWLERCLEHLLPQLTDEIEVIISDNCSPDDTQEFCEILIQNNNITYFRQPKNLGADGNFLWCLQNAKGKYIQLLADDDYMADGAVTKLIDFISHNDFAFGVINSKSEEKGLLSDTVAFNNCTDRGYNGAREVGEFFEKINVMLTFSSSLIFNRKCFNQVVNPQQYYNTNLLQSHVAFEMLKYDMRATLIPSVLCCAEGNNSAGYNIYKVFIKNFKETLFITAKNAGVPKKALVKTYNQNLKQFIKFWLIRQKIEGKLAFDTKHRGRYLLSAWRFKEAWKTLYPLAIIPKFLFKPLLKFKIKLNKIFKKNR